MVETEATNEQKRKRGLLEQIISGENLRRAAKRVKANRGSGGTDGMTVYELEQWLDENLESLQQQLRDGKYRPQPVRRVEIPKDSKGKTRKLGIPTVIDRTIQEAICQVLSPIYEEQFSDYSYGFRPERSTHDALRQCQVHISPRAIAG
jgi:retron-type reverse transcriptase